MSDANHSHSGYEAFLYVSWPRPLNSQEEVNFAWNVLYEIMYREHPHIFLPPCDPQPIMVLHYFPTPPPPTPPPLMPAPDIVFSNAYLDIDNVIFYLENGEDFFDLTLVPDNLL